MLSKEKKISERLLEVIQLSGVTWVELSKITGVNVSSLSKYKNMHQCPNMATIKKICQGINKSHQYVTTGKGSPLDQYRETSSVRATSVQLYGIEDGGKTWVNVVPLSLEEACREAPLRRLLEMTAVVLQSGTTHAGALMSNVEAFYEAVRDKQDKDAKTAELEALKIRVARLEDKLDNAGNDG